MLFAQRGTSVRCALQCSLHSGQLGCCRFDKTSCSFHGGAVLAPAENVLRLQEALLYSPAGSSWPDFKGEAPAECRPCMSLRRRKQQSFEFGSVDLLKMSKEAKEVVWDTMPVQRGLNLQRCLHDCTWAFHERIFDSSSRYGEHLLGGNQGA